MKYSKVGIVVPFYPWYRGYDRTDELFNVMIPPLLRNGGPDSFELSIIDAGVRDIWGCGRKPVDLQYRLSQIWPGVKYKQTVEALTPDNHIRPNRFWVSRSINMAVDMVGCEYLFVLNIDIMLPIGFVDAYYAHVKPGHVWFPKCYNVRRDMSLSHENGGWRCGTGMIGITAKDYVDVGRTDETYIKDRHDSNLYERCVKKFSYVREPLLGMFHIDHPGTTEGNSLFKGSWGINNDGLLDMLLIIAHPDDETIWFGGLVYRWAKTGKRVGILCMCAGKDSPRAVELNEAAGKLGACVVEYGGFRDCNLRSVNPLVFFMEDAWREWGGWFPAVDKVKEVVDRWKPKTIFTHGIDGDGYHCNHAQTAQVADRVGVLCGIDVIHRGKTHPGSVDYQWTEEELLVAKDSLGCHKSQGCPDIKYGECSWFTKWEKR